MKRTKQTSLVACLLTFALLGTLTGCMEDAYNPEKEKPLPPKENYFDFNLRGEVQLNVNYNAPGFQALVCVYDESSVKVENGNYMLKEGAMPIFSAFTKDGKLSATMYIATAISKAYLFTNKYGLPDCVELKADPAGFSYDATQLSATSRATPRVGVDTGSFPYKAKGSNANLYSLCEWDVNGLPSSSSYLGKSSITDLDGLSTRAQKFLDDNRQTNNNNENFIIAPGNSNVTIPAGGSTVEVTFMGSYGSYASVLGYYYYKKGSAPVSETDFSNMKKYIVFPNTDLLNRAGVGRYGIPMGAAVKLQYFGGATPSETFPADYVVGWFFIAKGSPAFRGNSSDNIPAIERIPWLNTSYSNDKLENCQFVSLYDKATKSLIVGVEDLFGKLTSSFGKSDRDFDDMLFCVKTSADIDAGDRPEIPGETPKPEDGVLPLLGTVAFEDIWPGGGDYDLNDVIIEYKREISFNSNNKATKTVETFTPVQPKGSADQNNYFACQYKNIGDMTVGSGVIKEQGTNSFVIEQSVKDMSGISYTVTRILNGTQSQTEVAEDFNPFIITKNYTTANRVEVHLPMYDMTTAADPSLMTKENAYYVGASGLYPFAICIPVTKFKPADEHKRIDAEGQYPSFANWVKSKGEQDKDWYLHGKK